MNTGEMKTGSKPQKAVLIAGGLLFTALAAVVALSVRTSSDNGASPNAGNQTSPATLDSSDNPEAADKAVYSITYDVPWSSATHPDTLPAGAHVSPLVITSHRGGNSLFISGTPATEGIEMMAETGATQVLLDEINGNPSVLNSAVGTRIDAPDSIGLTLEFDQDHSSLSAVSMLAPSPDWFVGVGDIELFQDGAWLEELTLAMRPYDAGTDSGADFTSADSDTDPPGTVGPPADDAFIAAAAEGDFATLTIVRRN